MGTRVNRTLSTRKGLALTRRAIPHLWRRARGCEAHRWEWLLGPSDSGRIVALRAHFPSAHFPKPSTVSHFVPRPALTGGMQKSGGTVIQKKMCEKTPLEEEDGSMIGSTELAPLCPHVAGSCLSAWHPFPPLPLAVTGALCLSWAGQPHACPRPSPLLHPLSICS